MAYIRKEGENPLKRKADIELNIESSEDSEDEDVLLRNGLIPKEFY